MNTMIRVLAWSCLASAMAIAGCSEPPPRTVQEFMDDPVLLEATLLRCRQEGEAARGDPNCEHARRAAARVAAELEATRRAEREAASARLREERRRREEAEALARQQAEEAARRAEEEAYEASWILPTPESDRPDAAIPRPAEDASPLEGAVPQERRRTPVDEASDKAPEAPPPDPDIAF